MSYTPEQGRTPDWVLEEILQAHYKPQAAPKPSPRPRPAPEMVRVSRAVQEPPEPLLRAAGKTLLGGWIILVGLGLFMGLMVVSNVWGWWGFAGYIVLGTIIGKLAGFDNSPSRRGPTWPY